MSSQCPKLDHSCEFEGDDAEFCVPSTIDKIEGNGFHVVQVQELPFDYELKNDATLNSPIGHVLFAKDVTLQSQTFALTYVTVIVFFLFLFQRNKSLILN